MSNTYVNVQMPDTLVKLADRLADDAATTRSEQVRRGITVLAGVRLLHQGTQKHLGEELGSIHRRLVAEFGEAEMLNKPLERAEFDDDGCGLKIDEHVFFWHPDAAGVLCCQVGEGDTLEQYRVRDGHLVKVGPIWAGHPSMN